MKKLLAITLVASCLNACTHTGERKSSSDSTHQSNDATETADAGIPKGHSLKGRKYYLLQVQALYGSVWVAEAELEFVSDKFASNQVTFRSDADGQFSAEHPDHMFIGKKEVLPYTYEDGILSLHFKGKPAVNVIVTPGPAGTLKMSTGEILFPSSIVGKLQGEVPKQRFKLILPDLPEKSINLLVRLVQGPRDAHGHVITDRAGRSEPRVVITPVTPPVAAPVTEDDNE